MDRRAADAFISALLARVKLRRGGDQIFLFGPEGTPFHAARKPVRELELELLGEALDLLSLFEQQRPRPFLGGDPSGRFTVAALDPRHDLYVVIIEPGALAPAAAARVALVREDLGRYAGRLREALRAGGN